MKEETRSGTSRSNRRACSDEHGHVCVLEAAATAVPFTLRRSLSHFLTLSTSSLRLSILLPYLTPCVPRPSISCVAVPLPFTCAFSSFFPLSLLAFGLSTSQLSFPRCILFSRSRSLSFSLFLSLFSLLSSPLPQGQLFCCALFDARPALPSLLEPVPFACVHA